MKDFHNIQIDTIRLLDSKAYSILGAVGVIAGLFTGFSTLVLIEYQNKDMILLWIISFIFGIVLLIFASWFCLKTIQVKYYVFYGPKPSDLILYQKNVDSVLYNDLIKAYNNIIIKKNFNTNVEKAYWVRNAIIALTYAIFLVMFAIIIVVLMAIDLDFLYSLLFLVLIILVLIIIVQYFSMNEKEFINKYIRNLRK